MHFSNLNLPSLVQLLNDEQSWYLLHLRNVFDMHILLIATCFKVRGFTYEVHFNEATPPCWCLNVLQYKVMQIS